jgi:hypothetical protein
MIDCGVSQVRARTSVLSLSVLLGAVGVLTTVETCEMGKGGGVGGLRVSVSTPKCRLTL